MAMQLRPYQQRFLDLAKGFLAANPHGGRKMFSSPTGTGKSVMETSLLREVPGGVLLTPSVEIIRGMLEKEGLDVDVSEASLLAMAEMRGYWTPIRFMNLLMAGAISKPKYVMLDEAHHELAETYQTLWALLGDVTVIGLTATPFRGTPKGTAALREVWGEITVLLTYPEAVEAGYISMPECRIVPLLDDDEITVTAGDISVRAAGNAVCTRAEAIADLAVSIGLNRPTMFSCPSNEACLQVHQALEARGYPSVIVTGKSTFAERQAAFAACLECKAALIQIRVVSEGVDLPIRVLIDCSPTLSPVLWLQQVGRIMRPSEERPLYVCTNRNLLRHNYLLDGLVPEAIIAQGQKDFGGPSARDSRRSVGFESLGKFKPTSLPLLSGAQGIMFNVVCVDAGKRTEYVAMATPTSSQVLYAKRESTSLNGEMSWGRWVKIDKIPDVQGFVSASPSQLTDKMAAWWSRSAKWCGLDPDAPITRKQFAALPVLKDLGIKL